MNNNFITNTEKTISLKERLQKLISASDELKFLVGFFYWSDGLSITGGCVLCDVLDGVDEELQAGW